MLIALYILGGFVALLVGGELLVRGASSLALAFRVSPLVIGLTVVAIGTSAPELAVSIQSCLSGATELAIGNAVGSNIANILLVLGASAVFVPLAVHTRLFRLDIPVMIVAAASLWLLSFDGRLSRGEGVALALALVGYLFWTVKTGRREQKALEAEMAESGELPDHPPTGAAEMAWAAGQVVVGLLLLVGGANYLVEGCTQLALMFGVSQLVVGIVVIAFGTSLPELATSVIASLRGNRDLAVGNIVGSNILNILGVLGISATVAPQGIPVSSDAVLFHIPLMVAVSLCCLPIFFVGYEITRAEGGAMLAFYAAYIAYIGYAASRVPPVEPTVGTTIAFVTPLALVTAATVAVGKRNGRLGSSG